jgi:hypothetical protein
VANVWSDLEVWHLLRAIGPKNLSEFFTIPPQHDETITSQKFLTATEEHILYRLKSPLVSRRIMLPQKAIMSMKGSCILCSEPKSSHQPHFTCHICCESFVNSKENRARVPCKSHEFSQLTRVEVCHSCERENIMSQLDRGNMVDFKCHCGKEKVRDE